MAAPLHLDERQPPGGQRLGTADPQGVPRHAARDAGGTGAGLNDAAQAAHAEPAPDSTVLADLPDTALGE